MPLCRGLVILKGSQAVTVRTPAGHSGFPKGKPEKITLKVVQQDPVLVTLKVDKQGKVSVNLKVNDPSKITKWRWETLEETSLRETQEETGISSSSLKILTGHELLEYNDRGNPSVSYTPALYISKEEPLFRCDPDELARVGFQEIEDVGEDDNFLPQRQVLLMKAAQLLATASEEDFILGAEWVAHPHPNPELHEFHGPDPVVTKLGHHLSKALRHKPENYGLAPRLDATVAVEDLLGWPGWEKLLKRAPTLEDLQEVVRRDNKGRFAFTEEGRRVRAQQGFSFNIDPDQVYERLLEPVAVCIHGTYHRYMESIQEKGLLTMGRGEIHCAGGLPGQVKSGMRPDCEVAIYLNTTLMLTDSIPLYRSGNGVLLTPGKEGVLKPCYFERVVMLR